ncbi:GNAT family N-acetyltransferase [Streptomyces buecherae]|uniref:GNAT family N-acetyltransferase n=1 Tax=Streptomyces buecherae TaxID=2763006 RepID=A0A7G8KL55_9ACTN|nr:GNAT family N-acyltransferase [Streptomyces buecherae]MBC3986766.1 GNAT family N-acetyltransferase [Streptomyces buecherae]QKW48509.1 GNAT family N-acetyltransferase [Streptomyces buecherae]QNJ43788.1 GNAT family N-acetyltransferase [Streptomyces buecherae]
MPTLSTSTVTAATDSYITAIADTRQQIEAAQRLRYQVFGEEKGAKLASHAAGLDVDEFDAVMDHLIVSDKATGEIVGTYRLLPPGRTERLFSEGEFDLRGLPLDVRSSLVEAGRACVHPDHRSGAVINLMWAGLARYVLLSGHRYLAGCASVSLADGGGAASNAWLLGTARHTAPPELRVQPRDPWTPPAALNTKPSYADLPPLLRGYLRVGAWMCGAPHHERDFDDADFFVVLDTEQMNDRYRRYFLGDAQ